MTSKVSAGSLVFLGASIIFHGALTQPKGFRDDASQLGSFVAILAAALGLSLIAWGLVTEKPNGPPR